MALDPNALILPGRGTVFVGDADVTPPTVSALATATPASPPTGFVCVGHTSRENTVAYGKEGGDVTQKSSWWEEGIASSKEPVTWSLTVNSLQVDALSLGLAFGGGILDDTLGTFDWGTTVDVEKALLVLMLDGSKRLGIYHPRTSIGLGDAPQVAVDAFFELQLLAQLLVGTTQAYRGRFIADWLIAA